MTGARGPGYDPGCGVTIACVLVIAAIWGAIILWEVLR